MICDINYTNPYFTIEQVSRKSRKRYGFVGKLENDMKVILDKLVAKQNISGLDEKHVEDKFGKTSKTWTHLKSNTTFNYIEDKIYMNDTLLEIKNKITSYLSKENIILPINQQFWFATKNKKYRVIGTIYEQISNVPIVSQYSKKGLMNDKNTYMVVKEGTVKKKKLKIINENNLILRDLIDNITEDNILYVSDLMDEVQYLTSKKIKIKKELIYGYLHKYWLKGKICDKKNNDTKKAVDNKVRYNSNITHLLDSTIVNKSQFDTCNIIQSYIHINWQQTEEINLLNVYNKLRDNLSDEMPFIKYMHDSWEVPYVSIYSTDAKKISNIPSEVLKKWIYNDYRKKQTTHEIKLISNNIIIKVHSYTFENTPKYTSISLDKYGRMQVIASYVHEYNSNVKDISNIIDKCKMIIKHINEILQHKIEYPSIEIKDDDIILSDNIEISRLYSNIKFSSGIQLKISDVYSLATLFPQYILIKKDKIKINTMQFKFIRISNFENMGEVFETIQILYKEKISEVDIITKLEKQFNINTNVATNYLKEWKKKIGIYETKKIMAKQSGVNIIIEGNNVKLGNVKNFKEINDTYHFITKFITICSKHKALKKDKNFRMLLKNSNKYVKSVNNSMNMNISMNNISALENNMNEIFNNSFSHSMNSMSEDNINMNILNNNNNNISKHDPTKADDDDIEKGLLMTCDDPIESLDVCTDICDDPNYTLRRLQRFDNNLFKFSGKDKSGKKIDNFSRKCGRSGDRQPIVLSYDPDTNLEIDRNSYTYATKFRSHPDMPFRWYICPRVWDAYAEKPVVFDQVTGIIEKRISKGRSCKIGMGPYGNRVIINNSTNFVMNDTKWDKGFFPGFLDKNSHPDKLCMPCCFESPQINKPKFKDCMGEEVNNKVHGMEYYIFHIEKIPLDVGRLGIISSNIGKLLGHHKKEHGYLIENEICFLRRGIIQHKYKSFIYALPQIYCESMGISFEKSAVDVLLNTIEKVLREKKNLFNSLNGGFIKRVFEINKKSALDNFITYLKSENEYIKLNFVWDLFQRPGIISKDGINIVIFNSTEILCPFQNNIEYDPKKKTIFLLKYDDYYEPIYFIKYKNSSVIKTCIFDYNSIIKKIFDTIDGKCTEYYDIDWKQLLQNEGKLDKKMNQLKKQYTLRQTIKELGTLNKHNEYIVKNQIMDHYFKVQYIQLNNRLILPVHPTNNLVKYPLVDMYDIKLDHLLTYKETLKEYSFINKHTSLKIEIVYKLLDVNKKTIVNVVTNTGAIIPIKRSPLVNDHIEIKYQSHYHNANRRIHNNIEFPNSRVLLINNHNFEQESYERVRLLLSKLFIKHQDIKDTIIKIKKSSDTTTTKRDKISKILYTLSKDSIYIDKEPINIENYKVPIHRIMCNKDKKCKSLHCKLIGSKCKLRIMHKNLVDGFENVTVYLGKIADELIRNPFRGNEILHNKVPIILDFSQLVPRQHEILLDTKEKLLDLDKYYFDKPTYHKRIYNNINYAQIKEFNFNKKKYKKYNNKNFMEYTDHELSSHWKKILMEDHPKFKYRSFKTNTMASSIKYILSSTNSNKVGNLGNNSLDALSNKLGYNILLLENRITKDNRKGFVHYKTNSNKSNKSNKSPKYILIYRYKINDTILCSPVIINNKNIIFDELPHKIKDYVLGNKNQTQEQHPHKKHQQKKKKKFKVIIKKKQT